MTRPTFQNLLLLAASVAISLLAIEITARLLPRGLLPVPPPPQSADDFWDGIHSVFGVWHRPNASYEHSSDCFQVRYQSNSVGARDRERARNSTDSRTIVLGDSMIEGWGLPDESRFSNLLERVTGVEHLNFGMSHFSPYQSYLVYRDLASGFDHDAVVIGITPENDFVDLDLDRARRVEDYHFDYRPYLVSNGDRYEHRDYRENPLHRLLRRHSTVFGASQIALARARKALSGTAAQAVPARPGRSSAFSGFDAADLGRLTKTLELLITAADGRRVTIVLIPVLRDLYRHRRGEQNLLAKRLAPLERIEGVDVVDLLPVFLANPHDWASYYFSCDFHWSDAANRLAASHLINRSR